jgi:hypothetical protein
LRTRRVKRTKAHAGEDYQNGSAYKDETMIDTSSAVKKKEIASPAKPKKLAADLIGNGSS